MPYIHTKVSVPLDADKERALKEELGKAISLIPGKSESWLMVSFEDNCRLWFKGTNSEPSAYVDVKVFGGPNPDAYRKMTAKITEILGAALGIPADRIYIAYMETKNWGYGGTNF